LQVEPGEGLGADGWAAKLRIALREGTQEMLVPPGWKIVPDH
jgi:hypothetical protein